MKTSKVIILAVTALALCVPTALAQRPSSRSAGSVSRSSSPVPSPYHILQSVASVSK